MSGLTPMLIPFLFGIGLLLTAKMVLNPLPRSGEKALVSERRATMHAWTMHAAATSIVCSGFILAAPLLVPQSRILAGALIGVASAVIGSAISPPGGGGRRQTDGWIDTHPFVTSATVNAAYGAVLSLLISDPPPEA